MRTHNSILSRVSFSTLLGLSLFGATLFLILPFWPGVAMNAANAATPRKWPDPKSLPVVKSTKPIHVKDGDRVELRAGFVREKIAGRWLTRLAYNGMIPGPTIIAPRGASIKLNLVNATGEPTSLHSHGLRVDDKNDGVVGIGQDAIPDKGSHLYTLKFPDAGLFWYHPHLSDEYGQEMGLQGNYWVLQGDAGEAPKVDLENVLMLDDLLVEEGELPGFRDGGLSFALMGRYGNIGLINNHSKWKTTVHQGQVARYWITNSANARPFKLRFSGARMKLIGGDSGFYAKDALVDEVILAPSERAVIDVLFQKRGTVYLENIGPAKKQILGTISVVSDKKIKPARLASTLDARLRDFSQLMERSGVLAEMKPLLGMTESKPDFTMKIDAKLTGEHASHVMSGSGHHGGIEWEDTMADMNEMMSEKDVVWRVIDPVSGKENMDINWIFTRNKPVKIRIINDGTHHPMQHPMHFHGQRFVVLARGGKPETNWVWKDTVLVSAGETVDVVLDNQNPGRWMGHCHISEHLGTGMMFGFEVR